MWAQFEDAMDDLEEDIDRLKRENLELEQQLAALGVVIEPESLPELKPTRQESHMQDAYNNTRLERLHYQKRNESLRGLLEKAQQEDSPNS